MSFLRKSCCLLRRDRLFHLNSRRLFCNLNNSFVICTPWPRNGHLGNMLLWTRAGHRPTPSTHISPTCMASSISGLGLGPGEPKNCEQFKRNSSATSRLHEESRREDNDEKINRYLKNLEWKIQRGNSVSKTDIDKIIHMIENGGDPLVMLDARLLLLQCCGDLMCSQLPPVRVQLAHQIVGTLQQPGASMTVHHFNALLTCYIENNHPIEPSEFLDKMVAEPNEQTFHLLLWCAGDMEQALRVIQRMKERGFPASEPVFNALVYGHAKTRDLASAQSVFETMQSAQLAPSSHTFAALLRGLAEYGDVEQMQKTFQEATLADASLAPDQILAVIKSLAMSGHAANIPAVLPWLPDLDAGGTNTLKNMLKQYVHLGLDDATTPLVGKLPVQESTPFGQFLLQEMVNADRPVKSILSLCHQLSECNPLALSQATLASLRPPKTDLALELFEALQESQAPVRAHFYWPLLIAAREKGEEELFKIVRHMRRLSVPVDSLTMSVYLLRFVSLEAPTSLLRRLQDLGFTLSEVVAPVLGALISSGRLDSASQLCGDGPIRVDCAQLMGPLASALLTGAELSSVVQLLKTLVERSDRPDDWAGRFMLELFTNQRAALKPDRVEDIIKALSDGGLRCSSHVAEIISRQVLASQFQGRSALFERLTGMVDSQLTISSPDTLNYYMRHPRNMDLKELECHLGELQAKKMNTRGVLRLLLLKYCQLGQLENVEKTKQELEQAGHQFSFGMKAALFDSYLKTSQVDRARLSFLQLSEEPGFTLDEHKAVDFATLLVGNNQTEEAMSVLEKIGARGVKGGPEISRNCRNLLVATSLMGQPGVTQTMLACLVKCGYCSISNKMLGPVVRAFVLREDLEGAVKEFTACATRYKFTPLHYELHCRLIGQASGKTPGGKVSPQRAEQLIQEVLAETGKVHGYASATCSFAIALAEMGRTDWLARVVKDSGKNFDRNFLIKRCKRLADEDKPEAIRNLIAVFRDAKLFNLSPLFTILLQIHCRHGDSRAALSLWSAMQETDCRPSSSFLVMLTGLLKSNKVELPDSIPTAGLDERQMSARGFNSTG